MWPRVIHHQSYKVDYFAGQVEVVLGRTSEPGFHEKSEEVVLCKDHCGMFSLSYV